MKRCLVLAGGPGDDLPEPDHLGAFDLVVCADGGAHHAALLGLRPDVVVGDLDSLGAAERRRLEEAGCLFAVHPAAKDETDLELALLHAVRQGADDITIIGAFGGRPDHQLANLLLLSDRRLAAAQIHMLSRQWDVILCRKQAVVEGQRGDTVSLIPLSRQVRGVWTDGLQYPLRGETLLRGPARGVSNVMLAGTAIVRVDSGLVFIMHGPPQT
jgi:thiamine pyrophosphokinase